MSADEHLNKDQFLDLYHNTSPEAANEIRQKKKMVTKDNTGRAYFTTHSDSEYASGFGPEQIHVRIPKNWTEDDHAPKYESTAQLDDEFPNGEQHYAVKLNRLRPQHFVD